MRVRKDRTLLEVNRTGQETGVPTGTRCIDLGEKKHHAGRRTYKALRELAGVRQVEYSEFRKQVVDAYWIPLADRKDVFVHFSTDILEFAADRLFPKAGA